MKTLKSLSLFFPTLNDARILPHLLPKACAVASRVAQTYEVIVIDDGSTDDTQRVVKKIQKRFPRLRVVTHMKNQGYGAALISGFAAARYDWIFYTDGDGQYDPSELTKLVHALTQTMDVVNGYKTKRADPYLRTIVGSVYNWFLHMTHDLPIRDVDCDFRLIRASKLKKINLTSQSGTICLELIVKLQQKGARFAQVPISHYPRRFGRSEFFRWRHLAQTFVSLLNSRF